MPAKLGRFWSVLFLGVLAASDGVLNAAEIGDTTGEDDKSPTAPASAQAPERPAAGAFTGGSMITVWAQDTNVSAAVVQSGSAPAGPVCTYTQARGRWRLPDGLSEERAAYRTIGTHQVVSGPGPGVETFTYIYCPGQSRQSRWIPTAPAVDIDALVTTAIDQARATVPLPVPDLNPPAAVGAPVQLGLWLAVADPGQLNVVAQVGSVWAAVTARPASVTWDMGNGDTVACDGLGTPLAPGSDVVEQGPCGYTYRRPTDLGPRSITVTSQWTARLTTSTGASQTLAPLTASTTFDYRVFEIVTIGGPG